VKDRYCLRRWVYSRRGDSDGEGSLGGNLPPGRAAAVFAAGKTHVFAIAAGARRAISLMRWHRLAGAGRPASRLHQPRALVPLLTCRRAAVHVSAIGHGGPFARAGSLARWTARDGVNFLPPEQDAAWPIPGGVTTIDALLIVLGQSAEGLQSLPAIRHWLERGEGTRRPVKLQDDLKKRSCYRRGEEMTSRNQSFTQSTLGEPH
jgi:hypothetical protein